MTGSRPPSGTQHRLEAGDHRAAVVEVGGGLRRYDVAGRPVLDGYGVDQRCDGGRGQLLLPWPNRLADGAYRFDGEEFRCAVDEPGRNNAIHGLVRWESWAALESGPGRVVMAHTLGAGPAYPSTLELRVDYRLDAEAGLSVAMSATNTGDRRCPFGAGAHPYVRVGPRVDPDELCSPASTVVDTDARGLPTGSRSVSGTALDFRSPRAIGDARLDTCFTDLARDGQGTARVTLAAPGGESVTVWMDPAFRYVMLYTGDALEDPDRRRNGLAVEPMTCPPNALRTGQDVVVLDPGETWAGSWGISPG